jgi:hypothetical protein
MKSRLHRIEIRNFKAFRKFTLDLECRHLLVYGPNGSGKSSLYWALYTFLQSARKPANGVLKYFDPSNPQNLLNIHEQSEATPKPGEIALTLRDMATRNDTTYHISQSMHGTHNQPTILKGDLASDFITYRFFFGFSHFKNSEPFNIWPLFEQEILPFCMSTGGQVPLAMWQRIHLKMPNPTGVRGRGGANAYDQFRRWTDEFAAVLSGIVDAISMKAQLFYDEHFSFGDPAKVTLKLCVTRPPSFTGTNQQTADFKVPFVEFGIQIGGKTVTRPQSFLNEAKLTQLALSVRFAASLVNLHESDLKLLVLDDLLVSFDMSNRMKIVEILLSETFAKYQKIILTHELGFFHEFRRKIGSQHSAWCFLRLEGASNAAISARVEKTDIQKAEDYLHGHSLDEAALSLRKAAENLARRWREWAEKRQLPPGEFFTLTENLRAAKNRLLDELPMKIIDIVAKTPQESRHQLIATSDVDIDAEPGLDAPTKGILKSKRKLLRQSFGLDFDEHLRKVKLIDDILDCTERVLNPAAHGGTSPLYEKEVQDALDLIKKLEVAAPP